MNPKILKDLHQDHFHPEHNIPMEDMAKLDKFRILKEIEEEEDSIVLKVEELKDR